MKTEYELEGHVTQFSLMQYLNGKRDTPCATKEELDEIMAFDID